MGLPDNPLIPSDGAIAISDATGTPITYTILYEDGDFSVSGLSNDYREMIVFMHRGQAYAVRKGNYKEIEFAFTAHAVGTIDASNASIPAAVLKLAGTPFASAVSTLPSGHGDGHLLKVAWTGERTNLGGTTDAALTLKYCMLEFDFSEGIPGKFSVKGKALIMKGQTDSVAWA